VLGEKRGGDSGIEKRALSNLVSDTLASREYCWYSAQMRGSLSNVVQINKIQIQKRIFFEFCC